MTITEFNLIQRVLPDLLSTSRIAEAVGSDKGNVSAVLTGRKELPVLRKKINGYVCEVFAQHLFDKKFEESAEQAKRDRAQ
jgi:hypothetical protein